MSPYKKITAILTSTLALGLAAPVALAASPSYTWLEGGYVELDGDGNRDDSGLRIAGSAPIANRLAIIGELADTGDYQQLSAGVLFHTPLSRVVDLNLGATFESIEVGNADDTGIGLRAGVHWTVAGLPLQLIPEVRHLDVFDETSTSLRFGGLFGVTPRLAVQAALQSGDDDRFEVGVRYSFAETFRMLP